MSQFDHLKELQISSAILIYDAIHVEHFGTLFITLGQFVMELQ